MSKLEKIISDTRFMQDEMCKEASQYITAWIEYIQSVRDQKKLYELMIQKGIGGHDPALYVSFALYFEKYERNFKRADE